MLEPVAGETLRERKKRLTRRALVENAQRMFRERGFDRVTIAEIADASDVSPKTVFVYFDSKEDLVFADEHQLLDQLRAAIRERDPHTSPAEAVRRLAVELAEADRADPAANIVGFTRMVGDHPGLHSRLQVMWEHYEQGLAATLAEELGSSPLDPDVRMSAALLVTPFRVLTSRDVRQASPDAVDWLNQAFDLIGVAIPAGLRQGALRRRS